MTTNRHIIRLAHPWGPYRVGDVLDTADPLLGLDVVQARNLLRGGAAVDLLANVTGPNAGWYTYTDDDGTETKARNLGELLTKALNLPTVDPEPLDDAEPEAEV